MTTPIVAAETNVEIAERENNEATKLFRSLVGAVCFLLAAIATILWFFPTTIGGMEFNWGKEIFILLAIYFMVTWKRVNPSEIGIRIFLGKPIDQVKPGPSLVPLPFVELRILPNEVQQAELPAEDGLVYEGTDKDPDAKVVPKGMVPAIRILFGAGKDGSTDPYGQRMVCKVTPVIRYRIIDGVKFITNIGSWERARIQIEDAVVSVLAEELGKVTPIEAMAKLSGEDGICRLCELAIDELMKSWGIDLESIRLKPFTFSHALNKAVLEVPIAQRRAEAALIDAENDMQVKILGGKAQKEVLSLEGQGKAAAIEALLNAETRGRVDMAEKLKVSGAAILAAQTARDIANGPGKLIIAGSGGFGDLATAGAVFKEALTK